MKQRLSYPELEITGTDGRDYLVQVVRLSGADRSVGIMGVTVDAMDVRDAKNGLDVTEKLSEDEYDALASIAIQMLDDLDNPEESTREGQEPEDWENP